MATGHYLPIAVFGALAPVLPHRIIAASGSPLWSLIQTGVRASGQTYANVLFFNGGMGATDSNDGQSTYAWPSNVSNVPVELIERNSPLFVVRKELRANSGGAGRWRGGLGQDIEFEVLSDTPVGVIFMAERCRFPAPGIRGGQAGARGAVLIDGQSVDYRKNAVLIKGQRILLSTPGGGGVGDPSERDRAASEQDRQEGYASE
jgi:N-methylhydantoinase B